MVHVSGIRGRKGGGKVKQRKVRWEHTSQALVLKAFRHYSWCNTWTDDKHCLSHRNTLKAGFNYKWNSLGKFTPLLSLLCYALVGKEHKHLVYTCLPVGEFKETGVHKHNPWYMLVCRFKETGRHKHL